MYFLKNNTHIVSKQTYSSLENTFLYLFLKNIYSQIFSHKTNLKMFLANIFSNNVTFLC